MCLRDAISHLGSGLLASPVDPARTRGDLVLNLIDSRTAAQRGESSLDFESYRLRARVRAAFLAEADRCAAVRFFALEWACLDSALWDAAECPSRLRAPLTAEARFRETLRRPPLLPLATSRAAWRRVRADALRLVGGRSFTPERLAFDSPMAIACLVDRAPCFPSRTWCISSRTNSPACVEGDFPSRLSSSARSMVSLSGTSLPSVVRVSSENHSTLRWMIRISSQFTDQSLRERNFLRLSPKPLCPRLQANALAPPAGGRRA